MSGDILLPGKPHRSEEVRGKRPEQIEGDRNRSMSIDSAASDDVIRFVAGVD